MADLIRPKQDRLSLPWISELFRILLVWSILHDHFPVNRPDVTPISVAMNRVKFLGQDSRSPLV